MVNPPKFNLIVLFDETQKFHVFTVFCYLFGKTIITFGFSTKKQSKKVVRRQFSCSKKATAFWKIYCQQGYKQFMSAFEEQKSWTNAWEKPWKQSSQKTAEQQKNPKCV